MNNFAYYVYLYTLGAKERECIIKEGTTRAQV